MRSAGSAGYREHPVHSAERMAYLNSRFQILLALFTGKSAACPAFLPVGRGGEGGNGLPQWSQSRPCNNIYITRKPHPVGWELPFVRSETLEQEVK